MPYKAMIYQTYALPNIHERRESHTARVAYWAYMVTEHLRQAMEYGLVGPCNACGKNTGNWCARCEIQGTTFVAYTGQILLGSPICSVCEREWVCAVCGHAH